MLKWLASKLNGRGSESGKQPTNSDSLVPDAVAPSGSAQWHIKGNAFLNENNLLEAEHCYRKGKTASELHYMATP